MMRRRWVLIAGLLLAGCGGSAGGGEGSGELTELVGRAGEVTGAERTAVTPGAATADGAVEAEAPAAATRGEVGAICGVYRRALSGRWDDQRTREAVRALDLTTATARGWGEILASDDVDASLDASREVVAAGATLQVGSDCEALGSLVAIADAMKDAPRSLQR
ncbi:MAG: hypothetical protein QGH45_18935 [Myxococcota bacterium]|jgi:hypothetical protein|nr:hypothetical protein [Myxococcota bacterium]